MVLNYQELLLQIIKMQDWLMEAFRNVRDLELPDWYIAAGAIRNTVWNHLHSYDTKHHQRDIDVAYFDANDMNGELEKISEEKLKIKLPHLKWEVINQARAHLFDYEWRGNRPPVNSTCESIAYWSETPTCAGIRLEADNQFTICAPHGLDDLMNLVVKPIPLPFQNLLLYRKRIQEKQWHQTWPKLNIIVP